MKKVAIGIIIFLLLVLSGVFLSGCDSEEIKAAPENKGIIEKVYGDSWANVNIFRDTETGREYIVFKYSHGITVTPRLPKEDKK